MEKLVAIIIKNLWQTCTSTCFSSWSLLKMGFYVGKNPVEKLKKMGLNEYFKLLLMLH
jgi:hypothetical protein